MQEVNHQDQITFSSKKRFTTQSRIAELILIALFLTITILYAFLMFQDLVPLAGWGVLVLLWFGYWALSGHLSFASPLDMPILLLVGLLPLNLVVSVAWDLSLPKIYGLILSILLFFVILNYLKSSNRLLLAIIALLILSLGVLALFLFAGDWSASALSIMKTLQSSFAFIPAAVSNAQINLNSIGGALAFFVPLLFSLLWDKGAFRKAFLQNKRKFSIVEIIYKFLLLFTFLLVLAVLILSQNRGAYIGVAVGLFILLVLKNKRFLWLIPVLLVVAFVVWQFSGSAFIEKILALLNASGDDKYSTLDLRRMHWQGTLFMIQDFPLTGAGIGTHGALYQKLYTYSLFPEMTEIYLHAHNNFLAVAVDLGIPALVLYGSLLSSFFYMAAQVYKTAEPMVKTLTLGLSCGMLAHQVFGLTDAFVLGTKLGIIMWIYFGIMTALFVHQTRFDPATYQEDFHQEPVSRKNKLFCLNLSASRRTRAQPPERARRSPCGLSFQLLVFLFASLVSITFVNLNIYLSLGLAIIGGILLGIMLTKRFEKTYAISR